MYPETNRVRRALVPLAAGVAWLGLGLQLYVALATAAGRDKSLLSATGHFFSYFTVLTNVLVALALTFRTPTSRLGRFFSRPSVRGALVADIVLVAAGYNLLLRQLWNPHGLGRVADETLHVVTPALYVLFWLLFVPKGTLSWRDVPRWLLYPLLYVVYALALGALFGFYPYYFLDVGTLGGATVLVYVLAFTGALLALGFLCVAVDRGLGRRRARHVLDHLFILCSVGAPEAEALARLGLSEGSPNTHHGQGTACRRFFFRNAYLELVWVTDASEAQSPVTKETRLFERWSARKSGASPFGVVLRPGSAAPSAPPFPSWRYRPAYLPPTLSLHVAVGTPLSEPELFYFGAPRRPGDMPAQPVEHPAGLGELTSVRITVPSPPSAALRAVEAVGLVTFQSAEEPLLTLGFGPAPGTVGAADLRPELPLVLRW